MLDEATKPHNLNDKTSGEPDTVHYVRYSLA